uniref:Putative secreted protein n=1 Tax=Ixodes ricinus TaxID=34613 RepID=A0A6B0UHE7_IXORI
MAILWLCCYVFDVLIRCLIQTAFSSGIFPSMKTVCKSCATADRTSLKPCCSLLKKQLFFQKDKEFGTQRKRKEQITKPIDTLFRNHPALLAF